MPNTWKNQTTLGDTKRDVPEKTPTSSTHLETKSNTRLLLRKQKHSVLVRLERTIVLSEKNVYGTQYQETNHMEYGEVFLIARGTPS